MFCLNGGSRFPRKAINAESKSPCNMKSRVQWSKTDPEKAHFIISARGSCNYHLLLFLPSRELHILLVLSNYF